MPRGRPKKNQPKELELAEMIQESAELENQEVEVVPVEEVEIMSLSQLNKAKRELAARKAQVSLKLDGQKLEHSLMIMAQMKNIIEDNIQGTLDGSLTPFDKKNLADAYKSWLTSLNTISRLDSVDSGGKAGRINIQIEYG